MESVLLPGISFLRKNGNGYYITVSCLHLVTIHLLPAKLGKSDYIIDTGEETRAKMV